MEFRESGETRRYSWDYDEFYDIYRGEHLERAMATEIDFFSRALKGVPVPPAGSDSSGGQ